jgi:pyrroline-5-carboxylate reductase
VIDDSDVVFIAVKPQDFNAMAQDLRWRPEITYINMMAAVSFSTLESVIGGSMGHHIW